MKTAAFAALVALALGAAAPALADPPEWRGGPPPHARAADRDYTQSQQWRDDRGRGDWNRDRDYRGYRDPRAFVNISFRDRFDRLDGWIYRSFEKGQLTRREARRLSRQLEDAREMARAYRRSDGGYTVWEADQVDARLRDIAFNIRSEKRDGDRRWDDWRNDTYRGDYSRNNFGF